MGWIQHFPRGKLKVDVLVDKAAYSMLWQPAPSIISSFMTFQGSLIPNWWEVNEREHPYDETQPVLIHNAQLDVTINTAVRRVMF